MLIVTERMNFVKSKSNFLASGQKGRGVWGKAPQTCFASLRGKNFCPLVLPRGTRHGAGSGGVLLVEGFNFFQQTPPNIASFRVLSDLSGEI